MPPDSSAPPSWAPRASPSGHGTNRRWVLASGISLAALLSLKQWSPSAWAQGTASTDTPPASTTPDASVQEFLKFSQTITEKPELSAVTAARILQAASAVSADFAPHIAALTALTRTHGDAPSLLAAADAAGLKEHVMAIVAAWYTGTVTGPKGAQVVAYQQALMYQPVNDGLPVPTYCFNGPLWWTQKPPGV